MYKNINKISVLALTGAICLSSIVSTNVFAVGKSASQDLTINAISDNTLEVSLSTNEINFLNYNGTQDFEKTDFSIKVSSGLAYDIDAILTKDLTDIVDSENKISSEHLGLKLKDIGDYSFFTQEGDKKNLVTNSPSGSENTHNIDIKLKGDSSVKPNTYKGTITFEVTQK